MMSKIPRTNIVVPAKDPSYAKSRLSSYLSQPQRQELFKVLFKNVLKTLVSLPSCPHVLVVTDSRFIKEVSEQTGASVLWENNPKGETEAVNKATRWSIENGYQRQLVIPGDMAHLNPDEVEHLLTLDLPSPSVVLCPAVNDDGTNGILTSPPDIIEFRFGNLSFPDYQKKAKQKNAHLEILRLKSFVLDLDTPEDLNMFMDSNDHNPARDLIRSWDLLAKVTHMGA